MKKQKVNSRLKRKVNTDPVERDLSFVFDTPERWSKVSDLLQHMPKDKTITLRLSSDLLDQYKKLAAKKDTKYQKLIREALIEYLAKRAS
ncbi:MAG: BrnA antitoxin family protein [Bdellovibrio sp.]|nr:BrnA antitoxin family protein [Bdellovibrio sp.]